MRWVSQQRERLKNEWESGGLDSMLHHEYVQKTAAAKGYCNAMKELSELEATDLEPNND